MAEDEGFAAAEDAEWLMETGTGGGEFVRGGGIEGEHAEVVGDGEAGSAGFGEGGGFGAVEVAGDAAGGVVAIDRDEDDIRACGDEGGGEGVVPERVATVPDGERAEADEEREEAALAEGVAFDGVMGGGDAGEVEGAAAGGGAVVEGGESDRGVGAETVGGGVG